jgi:hypothetical protein
VKRVKVVQQRATNTPRTKREPRELSPAALEALPRQTYLDTNEACVYARFLTLDAFYTWVRRHSVPKLKRGRSLLFLRRDLDDVLQGRYDVVRAVKERFQQPQHRRAS